MEPHSVDPAHELVPPRHEGVFGPLLWIDPAGGAVSQEAFAEPGTGTKALLVWVGALVAAVFEGVPDGAHANVSDSLRTFLRRAELPVVFLHARLPHGAGIKTSANGSGSRRELARAAAYALVQSAWLENDEVTIELDGESFHFEVRESLDEESRLLTVIR
jgi:hypothetical protein